MEQFHAHIFCQLGEILGRCEGAMGVAGAVSENEALNDESRGHLIKHISSIIPHCEALGQKVSVAYFKQALEDFLSPEKHGSKALRLLATFRY